MPFDIGFVPETQTDCDLALLRFARDGISNRKAWCQRRLGTKDGSAKCAVGWLYDGNINLAHDAAKRLLFPVLPWRWRLLARKPDTTVIMFFNDVPWRRHKRMVRLFNRAIRRLEGQKV